MNREGRTEHDPEIRVAVLGKSGLSPILAGWGEKAEGLVILNTAELTKLLQPEDDGWMSTEEAALYLALSPKAVRRGAAAGHLPGHKYPPNSKRGRWRFKRQELDERMRRQPHTRRRKGATTW
ncbi:MAG: helix-turn-helix domain-containing protein [Kiritimatiellae bacterium]|nr:helix-turn-helix domain-containing protein [Kiritimatiellia bacterium]